MNEVRWANKHCLQSISLSERGLTPSSSCLFPFFPCSIMAQAQVRKSKKHHSDSRRLVDQGRTLPPPTKKKRMATSSFLWSTNRRRRHAAAANNNWLAAGGKVSQCFQAVWCLPSTMHNAITASLFFPKCTRGQLVVNHPSAADHIVAWYYFCLQYVTVVL